MANPDWLGGAAAPKSHPETVDRHVTRRRFVAIAGGALGAAILGGVGDAGRLAAEPLVGSTARLAPRQRPGSRTSLTSGPLGLGNGSRDGLIQMPSAVPDGKVPLLVFLHGASQTAASVLRRIGPAADRAGVALLAPDSRDVTWDAIRGEFGPDVAFLNRALELVYARLAVDPERVAIGGFSDGASYGLSLGLANGDLFPRVIACSPGFVIQAPAAGRPRLFFSHGRADQILPIDRCSRVIVPRLRSMGYAVTFREFDGRHELPPDVGTEALQWMTS